MRKHHARSYILPLALAAVVLLAAGPAFAQNGKLQIRVTPKQAYVFVDGNGVGEGKRTVSVAAGTHKVSVYNYGFKPATREVSVSAGQTAKVEITLEAIPGTVSGPWGRIQIEGAPRAAILLNGKTPDYFVGHGDEFDNEIWFKQELLVPPGTHQVTIVAPGGKELWSGTVEVPANKRVIIDAGKGGKTRTTDWSRGTKLGTASRFKTGSASATVGVAPVTSKFASSSARIACGESTNLNWSSTDAVQAEISGVGEVPASGERSVQPTATTTYDFTAKGPGGTSKSSATVDVNTAVEASLTSSATELQYKRIGDQVKQQDSATITWTSSNGDTFSLTPFGTVEASGNRTVQASPKQTTPGPIDESTTYTLNVSNKCGGSATRSVTIRTLGSILIPKPVVLMSVYYPTDYPDQKHPGAGLLRSQQTTLAQIAADFKSWLEAYPDAKLTIEGHADQRGSKQHNMPLSERRVDRVKDYLVSQGVPADRIQTSAVGQERQLERAAVKELEEQNPNKGPAQTKRMRKVRENWLAYNRRVDIVLLPDGKASTRYYPHTAEDSNILWQVPKASLKVVEKNQ